MSAVFVKVHKIILDLPAFQRLSSTGPQGKKQIFLIPSVLKMKMLFCKFEFVSGSFCVPLLVHSELVCICVYEKVSDVPEIGESRPFGRENFFSPKKHLKTAISRRNLSASPHFGKIWRPNC